MAEPPQPPQLPQPPFKAKDCLCHSNREIVCLHCGLYVQKKKRVKLTTFHEINWTEEYGDYPDLNFSYKPKIICAPCAKYLERRKNKITKQKFLKPAIFKKPSDRHANCFVKQVVQLVSGQKNLDREKISYPTVSNFVRPVENLVRLEEEEEEEQELEAFDFLSAFYKPPKTAEKIRSGTFNGPEIRKLIKDRDAFSATLRPKERACWLAFISVVENFLGNRRADNYVQLVDNLREAFKANNVLMSLKTHYLFEHLDRFPSNCGGYSEERGENFHQETKVFERRYKNQIENMIVDLAYSKALESEIRLERWPKSKNLFFKRHSVP